MGKPDAERVPANTDQTADERVRGILAGDHPSRPLTWMRRIFGHLPGEPRCQLCYAPYAAPFGPLLGRLGFGRWEKNPSLCGSCLRLLERYHAGAEIELSMLFADLRGSTELAARMSATAYSRLLNAFYAIAARAIQAPGGHVDKYLGDGVFALFIPGFVGSDHAETKSQPLSITDEAVAHGFAAAIPDRLDVTVGYGRGERSGASATRQIRGSLVTVGGRVARPRAHRLRSCSPRPSSSPSRRRTPATGWGLGQAIRMRYDLATMRRTRHLRSPIGL